MKKLIAVFLSAWLCLGNIAIADELEFPLTMDHGVYELEVPAGDIWHIYNDEAYNKMLFEFGDLKLDLEKEQELNKENIQHINNLHKAEVTYLKEVAAKEIEMLNEINAELEEEVSDSTFIGVKRTTWSYVLGMATAFLSVYLAVQVTD